MTDQGCGGDPYRTAQITTGFRRMPCRTVGRGSRRLFRSLKPDRWALAGWVWVGKMVGNGWTGRMGGRTVSRSGSWLKLIPSSPYRLLIRHHHIRQPPRLNYHHLYRTSRVSKGTVGLDWGRRGQQGRLASQKQPQSGLCLIVASQKHRLG